MGHWVKCTLRLAIIRRHRHSHVVIIIAIVVGRYGGHVALVFARLGSGCLVQFTVKVISTLQQAHTLLCLRLRSDLLPLRLQILYLSLNG